MENELVPETVRIALRGEFDMSDKARLTALLLPGELAETVILDMSETTYIDTTALGCLIRLKKTMIANGGGQLHLVGVTPNIRKLLAITQLDRIFQVNGSVGEDLTLPARWFGRRRGVQPKGVPQNAR